MIKNFQDRDGKIFDVELRGAERWSIKTAEELRAQLDYRTSVEGLAAQFPMMRRESIEQLAALYAGWPYVEIMLAWRLLDFVVRLTPLVEVAAAVANRLGDWRLTDEVYNWLAEGKGVYTLDDVQSLADQWREWTGMREVE